MDRVEPSDRWHDLAVLVGQATSLPGRCGGLAELVLDLERALGLAELGRSDPAPAVTARRFARVHAAAMRAGLGHDPAVLARVDEVVVALAGVRGPAGTDRRGGWRRR